MVNFPEPDQAYTKEQHSQDKQMKPPKKLARLVERKMIENEYGRSEKPPEVFSPSQVGYCKRQMYNRKFNLTKMDRYIQGILHAGTVNHFFLEHHLPELAEDRALKTERKFRREIEIENREHNIYIHGFADVVDSEGYVYDHKFTGAPKYKKNEPAEKDKRQIMTYLYCLKDAKVGRVEYNKRDGKFEKGSENHMYHYIYYEPETMEDIISNMVDVAEKVRERKNTDLELVNPYSRCDRDEGQPCFYCEGDHEDIRPEAKEKLQELGKWQDHKEGEGVHQLDAPKDETRQEK